jgi:NAD(P)-dependent dehydrogenase (short-subunit alcohol dehydrogenase family)
MLFSGKTALVTGAASGIGEAVVLRLVREGVGGLVLVDRDEQGLASIASGAGGAQVVVRRHDVADPDAWAATEAAAREAFGGVDLAVVNAGVSIAGRVAEQTFADWRAVLSTNLDGAFLTLQAALRLISDGGAIVAVASASAVKAEPATGAYAASKAGVVQLTKVAAREAASRGVRVNAILPGGVKTPIWQAVPMFRELVQDAGDEDLAFDKMAAWATPLGRYAEAEEVAGMIAFLLSDQAATVTGAALVCDGGYSA